MRPKLLLYLKNKFDAPLKLFDRKRHSGQASPPGFGTLCDALVNPSTNSIQFVISEGQSDFFASFSNHLGAFKNYVVKRRWVGSPRIAPKVDFLSTFIR